MKKIFILPLVVISSFMFSQTGNVGINTDTPTNALHVKAPQDPLKLEGLQTLANPDRSYNLVAVVKKSSTSRTVTRGVEVPYENAANVWIWDLSNQVPDGGYMVDGNSSCIITLPKAKEGSRIFFFPWGGPGVTGSAGKNTTSQYAGSSDENVRENVTYKFKGSDNGSLSEPSYDGLFQQTQNG
ncbi:hypothetical protein [Riemerella columbipharyngis]|uniref:Uncharacterized protein n=1 Tax=Riemerella columbipharyngis TaxID=1071918 RepID=A0A1G7AVU5_9FLAO|nr:hypothetical protein [Riemerella columbipharyngis]SDE18800.1 hypothetical protein SAMN05421544_104112 [Riemerella columbipharyngis]